VSSPASSVESIEKPPRRASLIVNTKSRRGQEWFEDAQVRLRDLGVELENARSFRDVRELIAEARDAVRRKVPLVIAGGGDGTFSSIARFFVRSESVLGVLPLGTGNAFARDLGIPADLEQACAIVAGGRIAGVDAGTIGDDYFVNVATVGLTTLIAQNLTVENKRRFGRFVYAFALYRALAHIKPFRATIHTHEGIQEEFETLQVVLGNGRYHAGPFPLSPNASITEGKLSVYALATGNKSAILRLALRLPTGRHGELPEVHAFETTGGTLATFPPMPVTTDGEVCMRTPLPFGIAPEALKVVVPEGFKG
jgi:YegS/Rv2252/BmrU family lipid kinase